MKRLLKALEKAGLVEVEDDGAAQGAQQPSIPDRIPTSVPAAVPAPTHAAAIAPAAASAASGVSRPGSTDASDASASDVGGFDPDGSVAPGARASFEQRPFEEIYAAADLPASPFPAERLLRVLDGLAALEPAARKTAVLALDAADDSWAVEDSLLDGERKVRILEAARSEIEARTREALEQARAMVEQREQRQQDAVARIRQQIADLEGLLEREVARAAQDKADIESAARARKDACTRESVRIDGEIARLKRIAEIFQPSPPVGPSAAPPHHSDSP